MQQSPDVVLNQHRSGAPSGALRSAFPILPQYVERAIFLGTFPTAATQFGEIIGTCASGATKKPARAKRTGFAKLRSI